ncbi:MAG: hypothetical protein ACKOAU_21535 [Pirellula sp.]
MKNPILGLLRWQASEVIVAKGIDEQMVVVSDPPRVGRDPIGKCGRKGRLPTPRSLGRLRVRSANIYQFSDTQGV